MDPIPTSLLLNWLDVMLPVTTKIISTSLQSGYFHFKNCCDNDVVAFTKLSHVCTYSDRRQKLALIFPDLWSQMVWLWHWYYRTICANVWKTKRTKLTSFVIVYSFLPSCSGRFGTRTWLKYGKTDNKKRATCLATSLQNGVYQYNKPQVFDQSDRTHYLSYFITFNISA